MHLQNTLSLEDMTQTYWRLSRVWNGKGDELIETGVAMVLCNDMIYGVNPARPIVKVCRTLLGELIIGEGRKPSNDVKVIPLLRAE